MSEFFSNDSLRKFLQEKMPCQLFKQYEIKRNDNSIICYLENSNWDTISGASAVYGIISDWLHFNNIEFVSISKYYDNFGFLIDVMPEYISGRQAEIFVAEIIQSVPETMSKTRRLKEIKAKIRNAFHVEDRKYPRWAQDTDWPFSQTGKPLKYIARKMNGDLVQHTFIDVDTGEETIVEEFY